jgi:hypothetical protein
LYLGNALGEEAGKANKLRQPMLARRLKSEFERAIALDSAFTPAYIHAIEMGFRYGTPNGRRYLLAYLAQNPTDDQADGMRLVARLTDPALANTPATRQMLDTASVEQLQSAAPALIEWPDSGETLIRLGTYYLAAKSHEHAVDSTTRKRRAALATSLRGHLNKAIAISKTPHLLQVALLAGAAPVAATDSFLFKEIASGRSCGACAVSVWGMVGDTLMMQKIVHLGDSLARLPQTPEDSGAIRYTVALARAYLTLEHRDTVGAIREFFSLPDSLCHECGWSWLTRAQLLESQGRNAEAAAILDQTSVLNTPMGELTEFERARIAEKLGDKRRARDGYAFIAGMWQNGDPFFKHYALEANAGLKRLSGENSGVAIPVNKR